MIDHLLRFADEAAAIAACPQYRTPASDDAPAGWRRNICFPGCTVTTVAGDGTETVLPYWYLWVSLPAQDAALTAISTIVTDSDAYDRGQPFILFSRLPTDQLSQYRISPVRAGTDYPFGVAV